MKKITLVFVLAFCLVLFAGCTKTENNNNEWNGNPSEDVNIEQNEQETQDENLPELTSLYRKWWQLTCRIESTDENWDRTSILYIDNDMLLNDTTYVKDWEKTKLNVLMRDWKNYIRWDVYWEGIWIILEAEATVQEQVNSYEESDTEWTIECTPGVEWVSFDLPNDIKFSEINSFTY